MIYSQVRKRIEEIEKQCESVGFKVEDSKLREEYAEYKVLLASGTAVPSWNQTIVWTGFDNIIII